MVAVTIQSEVDLADAQSVYALIEKAVQASMEAEHIAFPVQVDVTIVDDDTIRALNAEHRGKDSVTDVLSFPMYAFYNGQAQEALERDAGVVFLGDVILNYKRACEQAQEFGHSSERECGFLTVHSCLHLLGYDHEQTEQEAKHMRTKEEAILQTLGLVRRKEEDG